LQHAATIEMESGVQPADKWDEYVKNVISAVDSPILQRAEKRASKKKKEPVRIEYSSDEEEDEDDDDEEDDTKDKKKKKNSKNKKKSKTKDDSSDDSDDTDKDGSDLENEVDLHARLLESMEKNVILEEDENTETPRTKPVAPLPVKPNLPPPHLNVEPVALPLTKPNETDGKTLTIPEFSKEPETTKHYTNGPAIDFEEQIRKISSTNQSIDMSKLVMPEKHQPIKEHDDIHSAIDDILKDEESTGNRSRRSSTVAKPSPPVPVSLNKPKVDESKRLKELEDSILESHGKQKKEVLSKKGSEVDNLISELNL